MDIKEKVIVKLNCLYILPEEKKTNFLEKIEVYDIDQLEALDKKLDVILRKLGDLTLKLIKKKQANSEV